MAGEAVILELMGQPKGEPISYTVSNTTGIEKGTICKFADPHTASKSVGSAEPVAGIAATEKVASDGQTQLGFWTNGIFDLQASGAITVGEALQTSKCTAGNYVDKAAPTTSGAAVIGYALESASAGEVIRCRVKL